MGLQCNRCWCDIEELLCPECAAATGGSANTSANKPTTTASWALCYGCDMNVNEACEAAYHEQCPPCAKLAAGNGNNPQRIETEILPLLTEVLEEVADRKFDNVEYYLKQTIAKLSAVARTVMTKANHEPIQ